MKFSKLISRWWQQRRERFYRRNRWHLVLDISLFVLVCLLSALSLRLSMYHPAIVDLLDGGVHNPGNAAEESLLSLRTDIVSLSDSVGKNENISWKINYRNNGNLKIDKALIGLNLSSAAFACEILSAKNSSGQNLKIKNNQVELENIDVNGSGELTLSVSWKAKKTDFPRVISGGVAVKAYAGSFSFAQEYPFADLKISSDLSVKAAIYFHSPQGDQLGIGPLPPLVGVPTTYWLIVKAVNSGNDLKNFVFSAKLPGNVELNDQQSLLAGKFTYNKESRLLVWQVDSMAAFGGDYIANFALVLTPSKSQIGNNAVLLSSLHYHADDIFSGKEISAALKDLDSSLPEDRLNKGQGIVSE